MAEVMEGALPALSLSVHPDYLSPGTEVNGFRLVRHANSGGYGSVWLAESVHRPGEYYAIKFCHYPPGGPRLADERAEREVRLLLQAVHPNVLPVIATGRFRDPRTGLRYLVMPWVEGGTLLEWTRRSNPPVRTLARLVQTVARALQAAHEAGVVHRDVKPSNVLVCAADGVPFLGDFGAGDAAGVATLTQPGLPPGTPAYRSPQAWAFARRAQTAPYPFQPADDWYALGVTLYVLLTQVVPFPEKLQGKSFEQWVEQRDPVPPHLLNPRVPRSLSQVVMRLLAKHPHRRCRDGYVLCMALERATKSREDWDARVYPPHVRAGGAAQEQAAPPFGAQPEGPSEQQRAEIARRRDELLPRQPRVWPVSRGQVAVAAGLALLVAVAWPVWRKLATRAGTAQGTDAPATPLPPPAFDTPAAAPPFCPPLTAPPWEQSPAGAETPPPVAFSDSPFWKEDTHVKTLPPVARNTLLALSAAATTACPAVPTRPEPPQCSQAAAAAMDKLGIGIGDGYAISLTAEEHASDEPVELGTGYIASIVREGDADAPYPLPEGTRLFGRVLPSPGNQVVIRYTELQIPPGERIPICAVAESAWKEPGNPEEFMVQSNRALVKWVLRFPK